MKKKGQNIFHVFLTDAYARYQYFLQRLRFVFSKRIPILEVVDMIDLPETADPEGFPSVGINLRVRGIRLNNPVTGKPMLSKARIQECLEGWPMQELFWKRFAKYLADTIPQSSNAAKLKAKFETIQEGRVSSLPPTADLRLTYETVLQEVSAVRSYLRKHPTWSRRDLKQQDPQFLSEAKQFSWWVYVQRGDITLEMIETNTPGSTALQVLMLLYGVDEEALRSRLHRR
jgi:hypothetical protein